MNLVERAEANPGEALAAFSRVDEALNLVIPGSDTHERYRDLESVGLAVVVARDGVERNLYNPFDPETPGRLSFVADNRHTHPEAWSPRATDEEVLGAIPPEAMGRFTAFALAKINGLLDNYQVTSAFNYDTFTAKGKVGLAGGQRFPGHVLLGFSGLWEVHDHFMGYVYKDELSSTSYRTASTVDEVAGKIVDLFGRIQKQHEGRAAASLSRDEVQEIVSRPSRVLLAR